MHVQGVGKTDIGQKRDHNEDSFLVDNENGLYIVCDGIGGHAAGEVASALAVQTVRAFVLRNRHTFEQAASDRARQEALVLLVEQAVQNACAAIHDTASSERNFHGMGTTITMLLVDGDRAVMGHVGDSRLYLTRAGAVHQLSHDHTFVYELVRNGVLKPEQAATSPYANVLTRSLGKERTVQVDTLLIDLMLDDELLLCSDGFSGYLDGDDELLRLFKNDDQETINTEMIRLANERGGHDNITTLTLKVSTLAEDNSAFERSSEIQMRIDTLNSLPFFQGLSMEQLARVLGICRENYVKADESIIEEGTHCAGIFVILEGRVEIRREGILLADLGQGSHVGEMSCLYKRPAVATVVAKEPCRCLVIDYDELESLMRAKPHLGVLLLRNLGAQLSIRLDEANSQLVDLQPPETILEGDPGVWL